MAINKAENEYPSPEELPYVADIADNLAPYWPLYLIRGLVVTAFGIVFLVHPGATIDLVAKVLGSLLIIEGAWNLVKVLIVCCRTDSQSMLCAYFMSFAANTALGVTIITYPRETAHIFLLFVAIWFILIGFLQLCLACLFRSAKVRGGADVAIGLVAIIYLAVGIAFLTHLDEGTQAVVRVIGALVTMFGLQLMYLGIRLKSIKQGDNSASIANDSTEYASIKRIEGGTVSSIV